MAEDGGVIHHLCGAPIFSFFARRRAATALINGTVVVVEPPNPLQAGLRARASTFPTSCRVGGCASCKCRLVAGQVRELTETGYILSDEELDAGYILACQSLPRGDVHQDVDLSAPTRRQVRGRVVAQERLTHDITRLVIQLEEPAVQGRPIRRTRPRRVAGACTAASSFACRPRPDAKVVFFIRKVPDGRLTGPRRRPVAARPGRDSGGQLGDFHLRPAEARSWWPVAVGWRRSWLCLRRPWPPAPVVRSTCCSAPARRATSSAWRTSRLWWRSGARRFAPAGAVRGRCRRRLARRAGLDHRRLRLARGRRPMPTCAGRRP